MLNQTIIVGKLTNIEEDKSNTIIKLDVKNPQSGIIDVLPVSIGKELYIAVKHLKEGVTIGVKAKLKNESDKIRIIAEKITFISSKGIDEYE